MVARTSTNGRMASLRTEERGKMKVLQTECYRVLAFTESDYLCVIHAHRTQLIQYSDVTTGRAMAGLLRNQVPDSPASKMFDRNGRCTCSDRYAPNYIAEDEIIEETGLDYGLHTPCESHMCATGMTLQRDLVPKEAKGISSYPKSMKQRGEMEFSEVVSALPNGRSCMWVRLRFARKLLSTSEWYLTVWCQVTTTHKIYSSGLHLAIGKRRCSCFRLRHCWRPNIKSIAFCAITWCRCWSVKCRTNTTNRNGLGGKERERKLVYHCV